MGITKFFFDTCIIIYIVEKHPIYANKIEALMHGLNDDVFCFSPLVRMECLVMPLRTKDSQLQKLYDAFFDAQRLLAMPPEVFDQAAQLRADFSSLKTPDALHLATAIHHNCDEFWTNDNRLDKVSPNLVKNILTN